MMTTNSALSFLWAVLGDDRDDVAEIDELMNKCMDGQTDGRTDRRTDRRNTKLGESPGESSHDIWKKKILVKDILIY